MARAPGVPPIPSHVGPAEATTSAKGIVELAADREDTAGVVVQGNDSRLDPFVGSGASHATGLVPDPGASAGATKYLREDGTWATPPLSGGSVGTVAALHAFVMSRLALRA